MPTLRLYRNFLKLLPRSSNMSVRELLSIKRTAHKGPCRYMKKTHFLSQSFVKDPSTAITCLRFTKGSSCSKIPKLYIFFHRIFGNSPGYQDKINLNFTLPDIYYYPTVQYNEFYHITWTFI